MNYSHIHDADQDYCDLVRLMRDEKVNCYHMVIPEYGDGKYWFRPLVRFASESAGSGNLGAPQVTLLQYDILYAYDLDLVKGQRLRSSSAKWASHMTDNHRARTSSHSNSVHQYDEGKSDRILFSCMRTQRDVSWDVAYSVGNLSANLGEAMHRS